MKYFREAQMEKIEEIEDDDGVSITRRWKIEKNDWSIYY